MFLVSQDRAEYHVDCFTISLRILGFVVTLVTASFSCTLKFIVKDCDPATGEPDDDEGYEDEYVVRKSAPGLVFACFVALSISCALVPYFHFRILRLLSAFSVLYVLCILCHLLLANLYFMCFVLLARGC